MSTRVTQSMSIRLVLADLHGVANRLAKTQRKLSSGRELSLPSDDPASAARALQLRSDLHAVRQYQRNIGEAQAWESVAEVALRQIGDLTLRARELVVHGANQTLGATSREALALEIDQLIDSVKSVANAEYAGRFVFSGSATQTAPYQLGLDDAYYGNGDVLQREIGVNVRVDVNETGIAVVGDYAAGPPPSGSGLLRTLRTIADDLRTGNLMALQGADLQALDAAHDTITTARARVGARANRLELALARLEELEQASTALLSETEDADMARTLIDYSTQQAVYQSALKAGAQLIQPSLIDFLQ